jgi:diguanylate cyclase (GGDEF)-like protein
VSKPGWLSNQPVRAKMLLALGLVLAVFVVGTVSALVAQRELERSRELTTQTYDMIVGLERLVRAVVDQQLSLRGYVITADGAFLDAHDGGREDFARRLEAMRERTRDNALQQTRLTQVSALMDRYWDVVADPILDQMEHAASRPRAVAAVASGQDGRYVDEMRRLLEDMQATEQEQLQRRSLAVAQATDITRWVLFAVLGGGVLLGLLSILLVSAQITTPLAQLSGLMARLAAHDHDIEVPEQARRDEVGAIARALEVFKRMAQATAAETWVKSGVAAISGRLQQARSFEQFAESTLAELAPCLDAGVALFYRYSAAQQRLLPIASLGCGDWTGAGNALALGEGPAGQCARARQPFVQSRHYPRVAAVPAAQQPDTAVVRPLVFGDALLGVIELGRRGAPGVKHERLLDELTPILALSYENLSRALQTHQLLIETRQQSEELRQSEEVLREQQRELRAAHDQLHQHAQRLKLSEEDLQRANEALREKSEIAHHQATHDPLTGVPNRLLFMDRLEQCLSRARRSGAIFVLCYVDIDGFKPVNDRHGHHAGDVLLGAIAGRLLETLRRSDTVARLGGDEFVLLMDEPESESQAFAAAERLGRRLAEPYILNAPTLPETLVVEVSASIGVAVFPTDARTDDALMKAADAAMYAAKQGGRNRCVRATDLGTPPSRNRTAAGT